MKIYKITLVGCDDSTQLSVVLTKKQAKLVAEIGKKSKRASSYRCMPILEIKEIKE